MNSPSDIGAAVASGSAGAEPHGLPPASWSEAILNLVASRVDLIQLEAKSTARHWGTRAACLAAACGFIIFGWLLLLAGGVSLIAEKTGWEWSWVALGAAALHFFVAIILVKSAKPSPASAFPVTRSEFQKDREWIQNFQKTKNSND